MAVGSEQRRRERQGRIEELFAGRDVEPVLDLLHLTDMAWHACYGPQELEIPVGVLDDILLVANGDLAALVRLARAAVLDFRDIRLAADGIRAKRR